MRIDNNDDITTAMNQEKTETNQQNPCRNTATYKEYEQMQVQYNNENATCLLMMSK